jgi:predicted transcriptional regulator
MPKPSTPTELATAAGISISYACELLGTDKTPPKQPSVALAIRIFRKTGWKHERIDHLSDREISVLERLEKAA